MMNTRSRTPVTMEDAVLPEPAASTSVGPLPRVTAPCRECPWRRDQPRAGSPTTASTRCATPCPARTGDRRGGAPLFACHASPEGRDRACAGWLAVAGSDHVVRIAVLAGRVNPDALRPDPAWPALYDDFEEMAAANGTAVAGRPVTGPRSMS